MRDARGELAVRELFRQHPTERHAVVELVKQPVPIPLGWWRAIAARHEIDAQIAAAPNAPPST
jgi:hypothetical protein